MATKLLRLIDACCEARDNPGFQPLNSVTFCNQAVSYVAERMGYKKFLGLQANDIFDLVSKEDDWLKINPEVAQAHANSGALVIAAWKNPGGHGHVATVRPGEFAASAKWKTDRVPKVLNIGKDVFIGKGANYAFSETPSYFVLKESL